MIVNRIVGNAGQIVAKTGKGIKKGAQIGMLGLSLMTPVACTPHMTGDLAHFSEEAFDNAAKIAAKKVDLNNLIEENPIKGTYLNDLVNIIGYKYELCGDVFMCAFKKVKSVNKVEEFKDVDVSGAKTAYMAIFKSPINGKFDQKIIRIDYPTTKKNLFENRWEAKSRFYSTNNEYYPMEYRESLYSNKDVLNYYKDYKFMNPDELYLGEMKFSDIGLVYGQQGLITNLDVYTIQKNKNEELYKLDEQNYNKILNNIFAQNHYDLLLNFKDYE